MGYVAMRITLGLSSSSSIAAVFLADDALMFPTCSLPLPKEKPRVHAGNPSPSA
jgi:hypothetical protein